MLLSMALACAAYAGSSVNCRPPIDLRLRIEGAEAASQYGPQCELQYRLVLPPGADPGRLRLIVEGIDLTASQQQPLAYQETGAEPTGIAARYDIASPLEARISPGDYDRSRPLIIVLTFRYAAREVATAMAMDDAGSYISGYTETLAPTKRVAFVRRLDSNGQILYTTHFGGDATEPAAIAIDRLGKAHVAGLTKTPGLATAGAFQSNLRGPQDAFLARFDQDGRLIYFTYFGGSDVDSATSLAVDADGNDYITGATGSRLDFPITPDAVERTAAGAAGFVTKLTATGASLAFSTYLAVSDVAAGLGISIREGNDGGAEIHVKGTARSGAFKIGLDAHGQSPVILARGREREADAVLPSASDSVSAPTIITSLPFTTSVDTSRATTAVTDPFHSCTGLQDSKTVWFRYTATFTGALLVSSSGSNYDTVLTAYAGTAAPGAELRCNDDAGSSLQSAITFNVVNGQSYLIEGSSFGRNGGGGALTLTVTGGQEQIGNDEISGATTIASLPFSINESTARATANPADPERSCAGGTRGSKTVWFRHTATFSGPLTISTAGSSYDTVLTVYAGPATLGPELACNDDAAGTPQSRITLNAISGQSYLIEVSAYGSHANGGNLTLSVTQGNTGGTSPLSVFPQSGSGAAQTFVFTLFNSSGFANITRAQILFQSGGPQGANGCLVYFDRASGGIMLLNNTGSAFQGPVALGSASPLQNSQCSVDTASSSMVGAGNTVTLALAISFSGSFTGSKSIFGEVLSNTGVTTGYVQIGAFNVTAPGVNQPPSADFVTPAAASGSSQSFTFQLSDPNGASDINRAQILFHTTVTIANGCLVYYHRAGNTLQLLNDAGAAFLGPLVPGSTGSLSNSQCTVSGAGSSAAASGNSVSLTLALSFATAFAGPKSIFMEVLDNAAVSTGYVSRGTFTVVAPGNTPPATDSVTPSGASGYSQAFAVRLSDGNGYADINRAQILISANGGGANACLVYFARATGTLLLLNDAGSTFLGPIRIGSGTLSNNQCTLNGAGSSVTASGNTLTLNLLVSFKPAFAGSKSILVEVLDNAGASSGYVNRAAYTVVPGLNSPPRPESVSPQAGSGAKATFVFRLSDNNGFNDINRAQILISGGGSANACLVYFNHAARSLLLLNDAGTAFLATAGLGSSATLQNSQCTVNASGSSAVDAGTSTTLTLSIAFQRSFNGLKSILVEVFDNGGVSSGYLPIGSFTVNVPAPFNDEIATATVIPSLPFTASQSIAAGSSALADPILPCTNSPGFKTVWFRYVAAFTGPVRIATAGSDYDTVVAVFPGATFTSGPALACNDDFGGGAQSQVTFQAISGQSYLIVVSAFQPVATANLVLSVSR